MDIELHEVILKCMTLETEKGERDVWEQPLTAFLTAEHPLLPELKKMVSHDHFLPSDLLPDAKSVIIFFIPFKSKIIESNLKGKAASVEWAKAYIFTNELISVINDEIEKALNQYGFQAKKVMATHNFDEKTLMSRWSHRHLAWIAGMGTFGINNMLITSNGCCGRFGSLVTNAGLSELGISTENSTVPPAEKCLNKINGSCGICRKKCPCGAYKEGGVFDRHECYKVCLENAEHYKTFGLADVCGKCLVGLPCSGREPSIKISR